MTSLVEDLLLLARLDSEPESDVRDVDLSAMVTEAVMDAHLAGPDHTWRMEMSEDPVVWRRMRASSARSSSTCSPTRASTPRPARRS